MASTRRAAATKTKVFDAHVHMMAWHLAKPHIVETMRRTQPQFAKIQSYVKDPAKFVKLLDGEGIERAGLINYVAPEIMGFPPAVNEWVHDYTKGHRDRLVPFGGIHPLHTDNPRKDVETLLFTYEIAAVKIHPVHTGFAANDYELGHSTLRILYEACEREGIPVMIHTGTSIFPLARNRFGNPMDVDDLAVDFPKLKIIIAHAGRPLWMDTAMFLVRRHPNVFFDISGIPPKKLLEYLPDLERYADKALFGSDWPGPMIPSMGENAKAVNGLPLSTKTRRRLLHDNAARLFPHP